MEQMTLQLKTTIEDKYRAWRETAHGSQVFNMMVKYALEAGQNGRRFGIGLVAERVRWYSHINAWDGTGYKISNNYRAYIARDIVSMHPHLRPLIRFRATEGEKLRGIRHDN